MDWLAGTLLNDYVGRYYADATVLSQLATSFCEMAAGLERAGIAHGDLQHGNVLVVNHKPMLIDYDGMFVKPMARRAGHELGHRNYQHPDRKEYDFGPEIDRFSFWMIVLSLHVIRIDPTLWVELNGGDDALLFRAADFKSPSSSAAFKAIRARRNANLTQMATRLEALCVGTISAVGAITESELSTQIADPAKGASAGTDWIKGLHGTGLGKPHPTSGTASGLDWLADYLPPVSQVVTPVRRPLVLAQILAGIVSQFLILFEPITTNAPVTVILGAQAVIFLLSVLGISLAYRSDPAIEERNRNRVSWGLAVAEVHRREHDLKSVLARLETQREEIKTCRKILDASVAQLRITADQAKRGARVMHENVLSKVTQARQAIDSAERRELGAVDDKYQIRERAETSQISRLTTKRDSELASALNKLREQHIARHLQAHTISSANISGIGETLHSRLRAAGIKTAHDATSHRVANVTGIGPQKAGSISSWRGYIESAARQTQPRDLDGATRAAIDARYSAQVSTCRATLSSLKAARQREHDQIRSVMHTKRQGFDSELQASERQLSATTAAADSELGRALDAAKLKWSTDDAALQRTYSEIDKAKASAQNELASARSLNSVAEQSLKPYRPLSFVRWLKYQIAG